MEQLILALCVGEDVQEPWRSFDAQLFGKRSLLRVVRAEVLAEMRL